MRPTPGELDSVLQLLRKEDKRKELGLTFVEKLVEEYEPLKSSYKVYLQLLLTLPHTSAKIFEILDSMKKQTLLTRLVNDLRLQTVAKLSEEQFFQEK